MIRRLAALLTAALLAAVSLPTPAQTVVQGILAQTYSWPGGANTGFIAPSVLMQTLQGTASSWSGQTIDCSVNTCLNFPTPTPYAYVVGTPTARTLSLSTAYQCLNTAKPCAVTINISSTATLSLGGGTTNTALVVMGATSAVASGTGSNVAPYTNSQTGSVVVGVGLSAVLTASQRIDVPVGWFFAIIQQTGTVTIASAFDQPMG